MQRYISRNGATYGPYDENQLSQHLASGLISLRDLACEAGKQQWEPLFLSLKASALPDTQVKIARSGSEIMQGNLGDLYRALNENRVLISDHVWYPGLENWINVSDLIATDSKRYVIVKRGAAEYGPYEAEQIAAFLRTGSVTCQDFAWVPGLMNWVQLQALLDFLGIELEYYIERNGEKYGPYNRKQLQEYREAGNLGDEDVVTADGGYRSRGSNFADDSSSDGISNPFDEIDDDALSDTSLDDALSVGELDDALADEIDGDSLSEGVGDLLEILGNDDED